MSLEIFVRKCGSWGLIPNNANALAAYQEMKVMSRTCAGAGYTHMLNALCMAIPDLSDVGSLEQLKGKGAMERLTVVLACHEVLHGLHFALDKPSYKARIKKRIPDWDNEEEQLTIAGDTGSIALPAAVEVHANPRLFNEHSLCRILKLSNRPDHHSAPHDVASNDVVDLSALPTGIPFWTQLLAEAD